MKDEDYLVHNLNKIATELKHINWNLGKLVAVVTKNPKLLKELEENGKSER